MVDPSPNTKKIKRIRRALQVSRGRTSLSHDEPARGSIKTVSNAEEILNGALKLSTGERARIARELLASLDDRADENNDQAWVDELETRAAEIRNGTAELEDWDSVRKTISANLRK
jgi:putative addiction module component (TIGR02574 family)